MKENNQNNIHNFIQYNEIIRPEMLDITSPLRDKLKIQFHCTRVYPDGHYFDLGHKVDFLKKSYAYDLMSQGSFFINEFDAFKANNSYISLWPTHPKDPYLQWLYDSDIWQGFEIYEKQDSYIQIWTFVSSRSQENITNFYLNNISLLKEFIFYFKEKGGYILDSLPKECLPFSDAYKPYFTPPKNQDDLGIETLKNQIKVKHYNLNYKGKNLILTRREAECLMYLSMGKSTKESAKLLHLSPRTVEAYLQNLKLKLHCNATSHLVDLFLKTSLKPDVFY